MIAIPTRRYRLTLRLVSPLLLLHMVWQAGKDGGWRYVKERLGFIREDQQQRIHIHAASVGEVITVLPLIANIQAREPAPAFLITTNTPTGASILAARLQGDAIHAYLPLDFPGATKRFYNKLNVSSLWIVETEIWPWLYSRANQFDIPIAIINARLSHKSHGTIANVFEGTYANALNNVQVFARSTEDAERYIKRGARKENVLTIGNLKFAQPEHVKQPVRLLRIPYLLAASTHEDEELLLAQAWLNSSANELLVIAPRHPARGPRLIKSLNALQKEIAPELPVIAQRSRGEQPQTNSKLYLADTLGEMHDWYAYANVAFVGGSLIQRGGHNVLEPARAKTPIIVGTHMFNFSEAVDLLKSVEGIAIAQNADEVIQLMKLSLSNITWSHGMGQRAARAVESQKDVIDKYTESLANFIKKSELKK